MSTALFQHSAVYTTHVIVYTPNASWAKLLTKYKKKRGEIILIEVNLARVCFYVAAFYAALNFYNKAYYVNESF